MMININDLYTYRDIFPNSVGTLICEYVVKKYIDLTNSTETDAYILTCTQRIIIPNNSPFNSSTQYDNYPALIKSNVKVILNNPSNSSIRVRNYFPKTLNTNVTSNQGSTSGSDFSSSQQYSSGSSRDQTNSYGVSIDAGFFGEAPTGGISGNFEHSSSVSEYSSRGTDRGVSSNSQYSNDDSMSIKDWGSYAYLPPDSTGQDIGITWFWSQEYPWNIMQFFQQVSTSSTRINLPQYIENRLCYSPLSTSTSKTIFPPTQLSLFGVDFTSKVSWYVNVPKQYENLASFSHTINYSTASHGLDDEDNFYANITPYSQPWNDDNSPLLDLAQLALDPITDSTLSDGPVIGFLEKKFTATPSNGENFEIVSSANNLLIRGNGFNSPMLTDFSSAVNASIYFKIVDDTTDYNLYLKCWKTTPVNCVLNIVVNNSYTIVRNVNDLEGEGGENNLVVINLRNKDYTSIDYHDYLQFGLNTISITISPESNGTAGFFLRTAAIG